MNPTYSLDPAHHVIHLQYHGATTFESWAATLEAALADPACRDSFDVLVDRRGVDQVPTTETLHQAVDFFDRHSTRLRRVASVVESGAVYGMCRMLEVFSERTRVEFRVFRTYDEAKAWLANAPVHRVA